MPNYQTLARSFEFPPAYHQAGMNLLCFFASLLQRRYPEDVRGVTLRLENQNSILSIDIREQLRNQVEQLFELFGQVLVGNVPPEKFSRDVMDIIELKTELRLAENRIQAQREILLVHDLQAQHLYKLLALGLGT